MDNYWLQQIVNDDDLGLLKLKVTTQKPTADEHLLNGFEGINDFVTRNGKQPTANMGNIVEYQLFSRLENIKNNTKHKSALEQYDIHGLLK